MNFRSIVASILDTLLPPRCHGCGGPLHGKGGADLCDGCRSGMKVISPPLCIRCGIPFVSYGGGDHLCGECSSSPPRFSAARSALVYEGVTASMIHELKYGGKTVRRRVLADLVMEFLGDELKTWGVDLVLPVPLHPRRLRTRGFNQALLLAEVMAGRLSLPLERSLLERVRETPSQTSLSRDERLRGLRGAFAVSRPSRVEGRTVLVVDDVMTTGATLNECAALLFSAGAREVYAVSVARTVRDR